MNREIVKELSKFYESEYDIGKLMKISDPDWFMIKKISVQE